MKLRSLIPCGARCLHVGLLKEHHVVPNPTLYRSSSLPPAVTNRIAFAHSCPYRSNSATQEPDIGTKSKSSVSLGASTSIYSKFAPSFRLGSSGALRKGVSRYGLEGGALAKQFNPLKGKLLIHGEKELKELWVQDGDVITTADTSVRYLPASAHGRYLNVVFGRGGWCLFPLEELQVQELSEGFLLTRKFGFVSHGALLSDTCTEFVLTRKSAKYGVESIRSKAVSVFSRRMGLGLAAA